MTTTRKKSNAPHTWHVDEDTKIVAKDLKFKSGDATLSGTAYLPATGTNLPGVVALHGASGPSKGLRFYEHLRKGLPKMGMGVLLFDRRGTGGSSGDASPTDYDVLAYDAIAGQEALGKLPRVDPENVGFWGISQGGWISIIAAIRSKRPTFAVPVSAPLVTPGEQMEFATSNLLRVRGYGRRDVAEMVSARRTWLSYLKGKTPAEEVTDTLRSVQKKRWFDLAFIPKAEELGASRGALKELTFDPTGVAKKLRVPTLFIYGGEDPWVPVGESLRKVKLIARRSPNVSYAVVPGANHEMMFKEKETMEFDSEEFIRSAPEAPDYFMLLASWLATHTRKRGHSQRK